MGHVQELRDMVVARLKDEYGDPSMVVESFRWSVNVGSDQPPASIDVDFSRLPECVKVWVFDPRKRIDAGGVQFFAMQNASQMELMLAWVHDRLSSEP